MLFLAATFAFTFCACFANDRVRSRVTPRYFGETVIFENLAIPGGIELFFHGVVVQMKGAHLCFPRVGIQKVVSVIVS